MKFSFSALALGVALVAAPAAQAQIHINESFTSSLGTFSSGGGWAWTGGDQTAAVLAPQVGAQTLTSSMFTATSGPQTTVQFAWGGADQTQRTINFSVFLNNLTSPASTNIFSFTNPNAGLPNGVPFFGSIEIVPVTLISGNNYTVSFVASNLVQANGVTDQVFIDDVFVRQVPGPLPIVGALAAFGWSRKLRRKIKDADGSNSGSLVTA